jgi:hypothetical protein
VTEVETRAITTKIPARLDRLPWARWHWMVVTGLGRQGRSLVLLSKR